MNAKLYPEASKLDNVPVQKLGAFLEYLEDNGINIRSSEWLSIQRKSYDQIIAEFAGCNYSKLEEERRQMIASL